MHCSLQAGKKSKPSKPAWALSQTEVEQKQMNEEDELLAFTEQLDFDSFMDQLDDVELKDAFKVCGMCVCACAYSTTCNVRTICC